MSTRSWRRREFRQRGSRTRRAQVDAGAESRLRPAFGPPHSQAQARHRRLIALVVVAVAFGLGYLPRRGKRAALTASSESAQRALPRIDVVMPKIGASDRALELPGTVQPLQETVLFARASGYVRAWRADIGDKVKKSDVLAEIETPELDQELAQAQAHLLP